MGEERLRHASDGRAAVTPKPTQYPVQRRFGLWGLWAGLLGGLLLLSPLAGLILAMVFWCTGAVWRRDELPVLPFCLGFQSLCVGSSFIYQQVVGRYPRGDALGLSSDLEQAVFLSAVGLLVVTIGVRTGIDAMSATLPRRKHSGLPEYDIGRLFWLVVAVYWINWAVEIRPIAILYDLSQVIYNILAFRMVLLCLLLVSILQQERGYRYGAAALILVCVPTVISPMSNFKEIPFLVMIVLAGQWRPWSESRAERRRSYHRMCQAAALVAVLFFTGVVWVGGMKTVWRSSLADGSVSGSPMEKVVAFGSTLVSTAPRVSMAAGVEQLTARVSAGLDYFSIVLERVPAIVPHANGSMTLRALRHIAQPRFLFPDKENLVSSSWLIREYVGIQAAGDESGTSVGLGYIPEFYIEYGVPGMFLALFLYGALIGGLYIGLCQVAPSQALFVSAAAVMFPQHFANYESEFAKLLGGVLQTFLVFAVLLFVSRGWFQRRFSSPATIGMPQRRRGIVTAPAHGARRRHA